MKTTLTMLLAGVAGALNAVSFAPLAWWPLTLGSLMLLFGLWLWSRRTSHAVWYGLLFGLGQFGVGISWIYISLHDFGGMSAWLAGLCVLLLVVFMSLYPALVGWVQALFGSKRNAVRLVLVMPTLYLGAEWLRGWLFTGLPWLTTGYAMLDTPLATLAPIGGVYAVSLVSLVSVGVLFSLLLNISVRNLWLALPVTAVWLVSWQVKEVVWSEPVGAPLAVLMVQNNVPLHAKWDSEQRQAIIADYLRVSEEHRDADLIVWPEAAVPGYIDQLPPSFWQRLQRHPADFIFGALHRIPPTAQTESADADWQVYNSMLAVTPQARTQYNKQHLVPFGEYFPFAGLLRPGLQLLDIPMSELKAWRAAQAPLLAAGVGLAASICYEDAFPHIWQNSVAESGLLVNISEDMWFGDSYAPHQRLQMARFRARETERAMLRASNNGLSSLLDWNGQVLAVAEQFTRTTVAGEVQPRRGNTPYVNYGNLPVLILALVWLLFGVFGKTKLSYPEVTQAVPSNKR